MPKIGPNRKPGLIESGQRDNKRKEIIFEPRPPLKHYSIVVHFRAYLWPMITLSAFTGRTFHSSFQDNVDEAELLSGHIGYLNYTFARFLVKAGAI